MNCEPKSLAAAARCYTCLSNKSTSAVIIYLLCKWSAGGVTPYDGFTWNPDTASINWTDSGGSHSGDLAAFKLAADLGSVSAVDMSARGITSVSKIASLGGTGLEVNLSFNGSLTALNISGSSVVSLDLDTCNITGTFDASGCAGLSALHIPNNPNMTGLLVSGLTVLDSLDCSTSAITGTLNVTGCSALKDIRCFESPLLTGINMTGLTQVQYMDCSKCSITGTIDVSLCANLSTLYCDYNLMVTPAVDATLANMVSAALMNAGTADLSGTNAAPTTTGPGSSYDQLVNTGGWTVNVT